MVIHEQQPTWIRQCIPRQSGDGKSVDWYMITPDGHRLRSKKDVDRYFSEERSSLMKNGRYDELIKLCPNTLVLLSTSQGGAQGEEKPLGWNGDKRKSIGGSASSAPPAKKLKTQAGALGSEAGADGQSSGSASSSATAATKPKQAKAPKPPSASASSSSSAAATAGDGAAAGAGSGPAKGLLTQEQRDRAMARFLPAPGELRLCAPSKRDAPVTVQLLKGSSDGAPAKPVGAVTVTRWMGSDIRNLL